MDRGTWWATVHGVAQSRTWLKQLSMHTSWWAQCNHKGSYKRESGRWERLTVLNQVPRMTVRLVAGTTRALPTGSADEMLTEHGHTPSPGPIPQESRKSWEECTRDNCHCPLGWGLPISVYSVGLVGIEGAGQETGKPAKQRVSSAWDPWELEEEMETRKKNWGGGGIRKGKSEKDRLRTVSDNE